MGSCSKDFPLRSSIKAAFGKRSNLVIQARSYLPSKKLSTSIDIQSTLPYPTHLRVTAKECLLTRAKVVPALTSAPLAHPVFKWDAKGNVNPKWNSSVMDGNRDLTPCRPVIHKIKDTLKPQGDFDHNSETNKSYKDNHASRPVIHKLKDHSVDVQPEGSIAKNSEYNTNFAKSMKGERAPPAWLSDFEKVTIE